MGLPAGARKGERTLRALIEAAKLVFARDGYLNAEVAEISKTAEKSIGTFYIYFENKAAILDALIDEFVATASEKSVHRPPTYYENFDFDDLRKVLEDLWDFSRAHTATLHALSQAALIDPHFAARYTSAVRQPAINDLRAFVASRQAKGACTQLDLSAATLFLEALLVNSLNQIHAESATHFPTRAAEARGLSTFVEIFARILELSPGPPTAAQPNRPAPRRRRPAPGNTAPQNP